MAATLTKFVRAIPLVINTSMFQCLASRTKSSCEPAGPPRCASETYLETRCHKKETEKKKPYVLKSMWLNPECCVEVCKDVLPRLDEIHYKASDKCGREYQQTWVECPKFKIAKKPLCKFEKVPTLPPLTKKRCPQKEKPKTACSNIGESKLLMRCRTIVVGKCPKISLVGCRPTRTPLKCRKERVPTACTKICTPQPSFSECEKDPIEKKRPVECTCLDPVPMCIFWKEFHKNGRKT